MQQVVTWLLALAILPMSATGCGADPRLDVSRQASAEAPPPASESHAQPEMSAPASAAPPSAAPPIAAADVSTADALGRYIAESSEAWASRELGKHTQLYASDAEIATYGGLPNEQQATPTELEARLAREIAGTDLELRYTRGIAGEGVAVTEWVLSGTFEFLGEGGSKKKKMMGCQGASVLTFAADGRVTREIRFCNSGVQDLPPAAPQTNARAELLLATDSDSDAVARGWLRAFDHGDTKALLALASDEFIFSADDVSGTKALKSAVSSRAKTFSDATSTISMCIPTARAIACLFDWRATWSGPLSGLKPNGKIGSVRTLEVFTLTDGKVSRSSQYIDTNQLLESFGINDDPLFWLKMKDDRPRAKPR